MSDNYVELLDSRGEVLMAMDEAGWASGPMIQRVPGPMGKTYTAENTMEMSACHSVVGHESEFHDGIPNRFPDERKDANGRYLEAASCQTVLRKFDTMVTGYATLIQMYVPTVATWTSGSREANTRSLSMELEGGGYHADGSPNFREPITPLQLRTFLPWSVLTERWVAKKKNLPGFIWLPGTNMLPHHEMVRRFGGGATACESGRYLNGWHLLPAYRKALEAEVTQEEFDALTARVTELERRTGANPPNAQRAHNADLLLYADGLNTAIWKNIDAIEDLRQLVADHTPASTAAVADALELAADNLRGIDRHVDGTKEGN